MALRSLGPGVSLLAGLILGYLGLAGWAGELVGPVLYLLLFLVGVQAGSEGWLGALAGRAGRVGVALGVSVMIAGALGGLAVGLITGLPLGPAAASGAASGWYSLAGPVVGRVDPYMGLLALLANMLREAGTIVLYPLIAVRTPVAGVSIGGATAMDSTLPVIARHGGREAAAAGLAQGAVITLLAPLVVPVLAGL